MPKTFKRGDVGTVISGTVTDADGPVPLGDAQECLLVLRRSDGLIIDGVVTVRAPRADRGQPDCGVFDYVTVADDVRFSGDFETEMQVTWMDGSVQTFPNSKAANETVSINDDLNPPA